MVVYERVLFCGGVPLKTKRRTHLLLQHSQPHWARTLHYLLIQLAYTHVDTKALRSRLSAEFPI